MIISKILLEQIIVKFFIKVIHFWKKSGRPRSWDKMIFSMIMYVITHRIK